MIVSYKCQSSFSRCRELGNNIVQQDEYRGYFSALHFATNNDDEEQTGEMALALARDKAH